MNNTTLGLRTSINPPTTSINTIYCSISRACACHGASSLPCIVLHTRPQGMNAGQSRTCLQSRKFRQMQTKQASPCQTPCTPVHMVGPAAGKQHCIALCDVPRRTKLSQATIWRGSGACSQLSQGRQKCSSTTGALGCEHAAMQCSCKAPSRCMHVTRGQQPGALLSAGLCANSWLARTTHSSAVAAP